MIGLCSANARLAKHSRPKSCVPSNLPFASMRRNGTTLCRFGNEMSSGVGKRQMTAGLHDAVAISARFWSAAVLCRFGLLLFFANEAFGGTNIAPFLEAQADLKSWTADFVQTRTLKSLKQPLKSPGHLYF